MNRKDRLYALTQRLRDGKLHTAEAMAQDFAVSVRTVYRDMEVLAASGVPVEGARGYGYTVQAAITLPPLNLTEEELAALRLGLGLAAGAQSAEIAAAARSLAAKIDAVSPEGGGPASVGLATDAFAAAAEGFAFMPVIRDAIRARQKLRVTVDGRMDDIRPLGLDYFGRVWTCVAWSERNSAFTALRVDRIAEITPLPGLFVDEPGKTLEDWNAGK